MADIAAALRGSGERFDHRDNLRLAWTVIEAHGADNGEEALCALIRIAANANGSAARYHETTTRFWSRVIASKLAEAGPWDDFDAFYDAHPVLHDKRLVMAYFSQPLLASREAFEDWVEPDLRELDLAEL